MALNRFPQAVLWQKSEEMTLKQKGLAKGGGRFQTAVKEEAEDWPI